MAQDDYSPGLRLTVLTMVMVGLVVALVSRLYYLQVLAGDSFESLAVQNTTTQVTSEAPRGRLLTSDGSELVRNRIALAVSVERDRFLDRITGEPLDDPQVQATLERLAALLDQPVDELVESMQSLSRSVFRPVPVAVDVAPEVVFSVQEHPELFPGVVAERLPIREYPQGQTAAHLVGYTGEITEGELADERWLDFDPGDVIGKAGMERVYDQALQGREGVRRIEVNASRTLVGEISNTPPVRGNDVMLTLDLELQQQVEQILAEGIATAREDFVFELNDGTEVPVEATGGAAIVMDPTTGAIRAMASNPTFDPRGLASGSSEYFDYYFDRDDLYGDPGVNRAVGATYPPASVWKVASGLGALRDGLSPNDEVGCPPTLEVGGREFDNWNDEDEGEMDLAAALQRSCDTFFYRLAADQWAQERAQEEEGADVDDIDEVYADAAREFGFGDTVGLDIPGEATGRVPDREWRLDYWFETKDLSIEEGDSINGSCTMANEVLSSGDPNYDLYRDLCDFGHIWRGGDAVNMSIGQGDVLVTPLQVAAAYGAVATRGTVMRPHLGEQILDPSGDVVETIEPETYTTIDAPDEWWDELQQGLEDVVMSEEGTGRVPFDGFPLDEYPIAGKTGTGQAGFDVEEDREQVPYSWFASYAPADDPQYVVVVVIERGGGGSQTSAPIVRRIWEEIFDLRATQIEAGPDDVD
ncbi:penicillin-binding protein 2 [Salsipaludibacter albus]|uniref:penicillin-binding protein 2 n=1 Tax=Salsipaludibacter albus TaxID=2849650 RepID=UPI001EE4CD72|nr:penicillin-binding protein 2 [Salsipaludibacter albus]MBY5162257.1 penicillin-binding protein 2 [Salsipaludibacter albus]